MNVKIKNCFINKTKGLSAWTKVEMMIELSLNLKKSNIFPVRKWISVTLDGSHVIIKNDKP